MASRTASPLAHPNIDAVDVLTILGALSDPVRVGIVVRLMAEPGLACGGFYPHLTPSALTRHFRVLREAGVIHQHDSGNRRENVLRKDELDRRFPGLIDLIVDEAAHDRIPGLPDK
ncbi:ArsR/SmtB family transcription factor [Microbacterium sp. NPDC058062]|uniref:ArsR/SmtB family transcription factor n=1 Tax=Microbacterium sp. NPDC058062 TaxID=3346320 RepID=UPI0036DF28B9